MQTPSANAPGDTRLLRILGGAAVVIALGAMVGWVANVEILVKWIPGEGRMVMNTALCALFGGLGVLALSARFALVARLFGLMIAVISGAVLTQFLAGTPLGIDQLFWHHQWTGTSAGRMAPNSAVAFALVALALFVGDRGKGGLTVIAGIIAAFATLPLLTYMLLAFSAAPTSQYQGMALPTVVSLLLIATAIWHRAHHRTDSNAAALPFMTVAFGMLISIGIITVQGNSELLSANALVVRSYEVCSDVDRFVAEVARMESSARTYALTGADFFRLRAETHQAEVLQRLEAIKPLVADRADQIRRVARLHTLADEKFGQAATLIRLRQEEGPDKAATYMRDLPTPSTSALVNLCDELQSVEHALLAQRDQRRTTIERETRSVQALGSVLALGLLGAAVLTARRAALAREQAERRLRENEQQFRLLAANVRDYAFYLIDPSGHVKTWNTGAERIEGYSAAEAIGQDYAIFFTPADRAAGEPARLIHTALEKGSVELETYHARKDGSQFLAQINLTALRGENGRLIGFAKTAHDVTERRRAETALRESEERFRRTFVDAGIGVALTSLEGAWLRVNPALCRILGYSEEELLKSNFQAFTHPDDLAADLECARALVAGLIPAYQLEKRYIRSDGTIVWINLTTSLVRGSDGAPMHFVAQIEDITARKDLEASLAQARDEAIAAKDALASSNRLQRAVLDGNTFSIIATDTRGVIEVFSRGAEQMLGYRASDVLGRESPVMIHIAEEIHARRSELQERGISVESDFDVFVATARTGELDEREWTYVRKDGTRLPVRLSITALHDDAGTITGFVGIAQDLTQRKRTEVALQASEKRLSQVLAKAECLVWEARVRLTENDWDWNFVIQPSGLSRRLLGDGEPGEAAGLWYRCQIPEQPEMNRRCRNAILSGSSGYEQEFRVIRDGVVSWIHETVAITQPEPGLCWLVGVATDITDRKRLEQNLATARDQALDASRAKSEFLATVSHELRTPLNGIMGMACVLTETPLRDDQRKMIDVLQNSTESLLKIVNDILDVSRIEAGKYRIEPEDFDLELMVEDTISLLTPRAAQKGIELSCRFDPQLAGMFFGDGGRVRQVLVNLSGNAIKFTDAGSVAVSLQLVREVADCVLLRAEVRDTGIGIPANARAKLFQPFTQADGSHTRRHGGTGLGLAICRQLIELMGGRLGFESIEHQGSCFWFELELPRRGPARTRTQNGASPALTPGRKRLLVAEDNPANQLVAQMLLAKMGHDVEIAKDGDEALLKLSRGTFDAVLMDCQMPGLDGYAATQAIRAGRVAGAPTDIPIIALTAYAMPNDRAKCIAAGMTDYVTKPLRVGDLAAALDRLVKPNGRT